MAGDFETLEFVTYALNALRHAKTSRLLSRRLFELLESAGDGIGIDVNINAIERLGGVHSSKWRMVWTEVEAAVLKARRRVAKAQPSRLSLNTRALAEYFGCDDLECRVFAVGIHCHDPELVVELIGSLDDGGYCGISNAIAVILGVAPDEVASRLKPSSRLVECGLVQLNGLNFDRHERNLQFTAPKRLIAPLRQAMPGNVEALLASITGAPAKTNLVWSDFAHLGEQRQFAADLLEGGLRSREAGVNILLYGPPGTGKTEFCKVVAAHLGVELFQVGESSESGDEPERNQRVAQLRLAQKILSRRSNAVLLFDEMEDMLGSHDDRASKVFANRLLEQAPVPTLWTCNDIWSFDPALLRRMTLAIEVRTPSIAVRERIWRRNLENCPIEINDAMVRSLAREPHAPPSLAATAAKAARLAGGGADRLHMSVSSIAKAMRGGVEAPPSELGMETFNLALTNADLDLRRLTERLSEDGGPRNFSLCLFGPPGTGKSAYVRHLAGRMGMEVLHKRASDLLGMHVGESEKNIADAFAEARDQRAFLIFDEADSLLADRSGAVRSWEITQVNEMLTWMEAHPMPFACTTNLMERLDPASLRRFTIKAKFTYLSPAQAAIAFAQFFELPAPATLRDLTVLTPGDFAVVERKARILREIGEPNALVEMLRAECEAKPNAPRPIGFR